MSNADLCPHCGNTHREGARFCPNTGLPIITSTEVESAAGVQVGQTGKLPPRTILNDRYTIIEKVGQGGMAAVYKTTDKQQPGTYWAVKEMSDSAISDPQERSYAVQSFYREAHLLQKLDHPYLPKVVDVFTESNKHYLVMDFVPGESLEALRTARREPYPERDVMPWIDQLCDVLEYLHAQNPPIIFRDLKPSNIMITPQGQVRLIDFGIVRFFKPGKSQDTLALGTPGFTPPEAVSGQTDERSDIYSLCVTVHQLLTGHNPVESLFYLPPAREVNPGVSAEMDRILTRGTHSKRAERWASVQELRAALIGIHQSQPPEFVRGTPFSEASPLVMPDNNQAVLSEERKRTTPETGQQIRTSRPTQRLILAASHLSSWQLLGLIIIFIAILSGLTWALAPVLDQIDFEWNSIPLIAMFAAFGYSAYPKRGSVLISHIVLTSALVFTIYMRLGEQGYSWGEYALAAGTSALFMEAWVALLPLVQKMVAVQNWISELVWLILMEISGVAIFFGLLFSWESVLNPLVLGLSAIFAGLGWFLGDLIRQYLLYRQTGFKAGQ